MVLFHPNPNAKMRKYNFPHGQDRTTENSTCISYITKYIPLQIQFHQSALEHLTRIFRLPFCHLYNIHTYGMSSLRICMGLRQIPYYFLIQFIQNYDMSKYFANLNV